MATTATPNTIAQREGSGFLYAVNFNQTAGTDNSTISSVFIESGSDGFLRKNSLTGFRQNLGAGFTSVATPGYTAIPGGVTLQWGSSGSIGSGGTATVTFPTAFSSTAFSVVITQKAAGGGAQAASNVESITASNFVIRNSGSNAQSFCWIATGPT
jgi:hypothetical protein